MRRILVTGANKGIGLAITKAILSQHEDTYAFMGSRDMARGRAAHQSLRDAVPGAGDRAEVVQLDVSDEASVDALPSEIRERCSGEEAPLYGIVNNAGVGSESRSLAEVLEVNTLGLRRVCEACLPLLARRGGRIVNITSAAGPSFIAHCSPERQTLFTDPALEWPALESLIDECLTIADDAEAFAARGLGGGAPYGLSKACANSYTFMLARRHPELHINACTPGFIETDMTRHHAELANKAPRDVGLRPPEEGTRSAMHLLFAELEGNGRYYGSDAKRSPLDRYREPGTPPYED